MRRAISRALLLLIAACVAVGCGAPALHTPVTVEPRAREVVVIEGFGGGDPLLLGELVTSHE